jgi:hypothetical protein
MAIVIIANTGGMFNENTTFLIKISKMSVCVNAGFLTELLMLTGILGLGVAK